MRLIIPKAASEQARWQQVLKDVSVQLDFVDPWLLTRLAETPEQKTHWLNLDEFSAVVAISPTAAQVLVDALDTYWPMPPADVKWLCNGPRTAKVMQQGGLTAFYPKASHTAESVLAMSEAKVAAQDKWLIVKGIGGRETYRQELTACGAVVTELEVYQRELNTFELQRMVELAQQSDALWLSSEFLGDALMAQPNIDWTQWRGQWWVSSPRLAHWAKQNQLNNIVVFDGATVEALKAGILD